MAKRKRKARILSEHFKRNGLPKQAFQSVEEAHTFLVKNHRVDDLEPYQCSFCFLYHVGAIGHCGSR